MNSTLMSVVAVLGILITATYTLWKVTSKLNFKIDESSFNNDKKISRTFERLDEVKKENDDKYVNKDLCKVVHENTRRDIEDIKTYVGKIDEKLNHILIMIRNGKNGKS